jgi:hypothetical protein
MCVKKMKEFNDKDEISDSKEMTKKLDTVGAIVLGL